MPRTAAASPDAVLNLSELVTRAEHAVTSVKDRELRKIAFDRVLTALLAKADLGASMPRVERTSYERGTSPRKKELDIGRIKRGGAKQYLEDLLADGFFSKPRTIGKVRAELASRGHSFPRTSLSGPLGVLARNGHLRRRKVQIRAHGRRDSFAYTAI